MLKNATGCRACPQRRSAKYSRWTSRGRLDQRLSRVVVLPVHLRTAQLNAGAILPPVHAVYRLDVLGLNQLGMLVTLVSDLPVAGSAHSRKGA